MNDEIQTVQFEFHVERYDGKKITKREADNLLEGIVAHFNGRRYGFDGGTKGFQANSPEPPPAHNDSMPIAVHHCSNGCCIGRGHNRDQDKKS